jgi:hypothetical protein
MSITVTLPEVTDCAATACGYNVRGRCHACAITVGDGEHPMCDTYTPDPHHVRRLPIAGVGACKVSICVYNHELECSAPAIHVALHDGHPDCATFSAA